MRVSKQNGFSLIETVIFIVIVGVAVTAIAVQFSTNVSTSHEPFNRQRALAVANAYMDEILKKRWDENSPTGGGCVETPSNRCSAYCAAVAFPACAHCAAGAGVCDPAANAAGIGTEEANRADYDDVDDYNVIINQPPTDASGAAMPGYAGFSVSVTVAPAAWNGVAAVDSRLITVTVTNPSNESVSLNTYRLNY